MIRHCMLCDREINAENDLYHMDTFVSDGLHYVCDECARRESNRIYNNMLRVFEANDEVFRKAFAKYGADDLLYAIDEENENA